MKSPLRRAFISVKSWQRRRGQDRKTAGELPFTWGTAGSLLLHGAVILLLIFGRVDQTAAPLLKALVVDLVPDPVPAIQPATGADEKQPAQSPDPKIPVLGRRAAAPAEIAPLSLGEAFALVERAHAPAAVRSQPSHEEAPLIAAIGGGTNDVPVGAPGGTTALNDFIRAQIERRWQVDPRQLGKGDLVVSLHLVLNPDGSLDKVDIVRDGGRMTEPLYRAVAIAARNAATLSSPLQLPAGTPAHFMDMVLDLNTRDAER